MAPKRPSPTEDDLPAASSSSVEEESEDVEESEEDDVEEEVERKTASLPSVDKKPPVKNPSAPSPVKHPKSTSDDEEEDDESSDSDSESSSDSDLSPEQSRHPSRTPDLNIKSINSKPRDDYVVKPVIKKPTMAKSAASPISSPAKLSASGKRPAQSDQDDKDSKSKKKRKKILDAEEEDRITEETDKKSGDDSKKLFQRLWSDGDEIVILKGMRQFSKKGVDPMTDMYGFLDSIKKSLHVEVNRNQLAAKIRRLKKKYENNATKRKEPVFSKPHEQKVFELSKKVWGVIASDGIDEKVTANGKKAQSQSRKVSNSVALHKPKSLVSETIEIEPKSDTEVNGPPYPCLSESLSSMNTIITPPVFRESISKKGLELIGSSKAKELDEKWRKLNLEEMEIYLKRVDLVREQTKAMLDALKSTRS